MSLLTLENIYKEYGTKVLLNGINLRIHRGERLALVGANGSGKTTALKIAMGLEEPDRGRVVVAKSTTVGYISQSLTELADNNAVMETARAFADVLSLEQQLRETEARMAAPDVATDPGALERLYDTYARLTVDYEKRDGYHLETKVKSALLGLGLRREALSQPVSQLSGGEKMRVALARTLLREADLLILDEPTNHLDLFGIEWLEKFLRRFPGGVLLVSHDRYFLDQVATRVAELAGGGLSERSGNYSTFLAQKERRRDYMIAERKRIEREIRINHQLVAKLKGMRRISAAASRAKAGERLQEELDTRIHATVITEHLGKPATLQLPLARAQHLSAEIAAAENLSKRFGDIIIFDGAQFIIRGGERIGLIGPNGSGKTTLLNILMGKDQQFEGFARLGPWVRYGFLSQEIQFDDEDRTVRDELQETAACLGKELKEGETRQYLGRFQFYGDEIQKQLKVLSGGERVRLALACICLNEPHCLILDEPTNHLDMPGREALETTLAGFKGTVIAITHDRYYLNRCVTRILAIESAKIVSYEGNYDFYRSLKAEQLQTGSTETPSQKVVNRAAVSSKPHRPLPRRKGRNPKRQLDRAALEVQIDLLERRIKELEASFNRETPWEEYREYDALLAQVGSLYEEWNETVNDE